MFRTTLAIVAALSVGSAWAEPAPPRDAAPPQIDSDQDGWVTRGEAEAAARSVYAHMDADKDGKLEPRDHMQRREMRFHSRDGAPPRTPDAKNGDGRRRHMRPPMMILMSSEEADTNGDGNLSESEFVALQVRFFDAAGVNRDGRIKFEPPPEPPLASPAPN